MSSENEKGRERSPLPAEMQAAFEAAGKNSLDTFANRLKEAREKRGIAPEAAPASPDEPGGKLITGRRRKESKKEGVESEQWTKEKLLAEIKDGEFFALVGKRGFRREYRRSGQSFLPKDKIEVVTDDVLQKLAKGWILERDADKVSKEGSEQEEDRYLKAINEFEKRKNAALKEIDALSTLPEFKNYVKGDEESFDVITKAIKQGKIDNIPAFDEPLKEWMETARFTSDEVKKRFREKAFEMQKEVEDAYAAKKQELETAAEGQWTKEKLLAEIKDGETFVLIGQKSSKTRRKYRRDGEDFLNSNGDPATDKILTDLAKGWTLELKDGKKENYFLEKEDEPVLFVGNNTATAHRWNRVVRKRNEYFFLSHVTDTLSPANTEEQIRKLAEKEQWKVVTDDTEYKEAMGLSPKKDSNELSPEEERLLNQMIADLELEVDLRIANIRSTLSLSALDEFNPNTDVLLEMRQKYADSLLSSLEKIHADIPEKMRGKLSDTANRIAEEIVAEYLDQKKRLEKGVVTKVSYEFIPLSSGEIAFYKGKNGDVTVAKEGEMYEIIDETGSASGFVYDEAHIQSIAQEEEWAASGPVKGDIKDGVFRKLKIGEQARYLSKDDVYYTVEKRAGGYFIQNAEEEWEGPLKSSILEYKAKDEGWQIVEDKPIAPAVAGAPAVPDVEKSVLQEKIDGLKIEVAEFRQKYAETDYEKSSAWKSLSGFFRNLTAAGGNDSDIEYWNSEYRQKLTELKEAELERIKNSGLTRKELKDSMAGLLRYYTLEEGRALYDARTQVRLERQGKLANVWGWYEERVKDYGKLNWRKKLLVAGVLIGLAGVTGGASIVAKRALSGSGAAIGIDALLVKTGVAWETRSIDKALEKRMEEGMDLERLNSFLNTEIRLVNKDLQGRKLMSVFRKGSALMLGVAVGGASSFIHMPHDAAPVHAPFAKLPPSGIRISPVSPFTPPVSSPGLNPLFESKIPSSIAEAESQVTGAPVRVPIVEGTSPVPVPVESSTGHPTSVEPGVETTTPAPDNPVDQKIVQPIEKQVEVRVPESPAAEAEKIEDYKVKASDSKKGLWGVIENRFVPEDVSKAEGNRITRSLENLMQQKLDEMSPAEQRAAGFPTGKIDTIQRGSIIHFDQLLSPDEVQEVIDGKDIEVPEVSAPTPPSSPIDHLRTDVPDIENNPPVDTDSHSIESIDKEVTLKTEKVAAYVAERRLSDPKEFLVEHPELRNKLFSTVGKLRMEIFMTRDITDITEYDYAEKSLGKASVTKILTDANNLKGSPFMNYDRASNPLHYSQMLELSKFMTASVKAFGSEVAAPGAGESIDTYTRRMATMAVRTGKAIKGFYKP